MLKLFDVAEPQFPINPDQMLGWLGISVIWWVIIFVLLWLIIGVIVALVIVHFNKKKK